jgi:hypothetical protein
LSEVLRPAAEDAKVDGNWKGAKKKSAAKRKTGLRG